MPLPIHDPKKFTDWFELDYFRRPRPFPRLYRLALGVAAVGSLAWAGFSLWPRQHALHQAGPLSSAHALFREDCQACHREAFVPVERLWPGNSAVRSVTDATCGQCHEGAAHARNVPAEQCATCHREHRGHVSLTDVADRLCVACHGDIKRHFPHSDMEPITAFAMGRHPPFRWTSKPREDPGTIRFNHQKHLVADGVFLSDPDQLARQGRPVDKGMLWTKKKLACQDCHRPDETGRYLKPIVYDQHCKSCHPLGVQVAGNLPKDEKVTVGLKRFAQEAAPHREPAVVRAALRDRFTQFAQGFRDPLFGLPPISAKQDLPDLLPLKANPFSLAKAEWDWVDLQLPHAEKVLFQDAGGCQYCHELSKDNPWQNKLPNYLSTQINERAHAPPIGKSSRWLPKSHFQHASHRMLACTECHPAPDSQLTSDVLLPTMEHCVQCHNPRQGVKSACVTCHEYHGRDHTTPWRLPEGHKQFQGRRTIGPGKQ